MGSIKEIKLLSKIFLKVTACQAYWPVESVEDEVEGGEEEEHPLVDDPSALLAILFFFRRIVFVQVKPYKGEVLHLPVKNYYWNLIRASWTPYTMIAPKMKRK